MAYVWTVSDKDSQNFPKDEEELERRLAVLRNGVPNQGDNIKPFVIPAFELLRDCGMIEKRTIQILSDKETCDNAFGYPLNSLGGVIRRQGLPMYDKAGHPRYYFDGQKILYVSLDGVRYYISNNWWEVCKEKFFKWLAAKTAQVCRERWMQNKPIVSVKNSTQARPVTAMTIDTPVKRSPLEVLIDKVEKLDKVNTSLCELVVKLHREIEILESKVDKLTSEVSELKRIWDN